MQVEKLDPVLSGVAGHQELSKSPTQPPTSLPYRPASFTQPPARQWTETKSTHPRACGASVQRGGLGADLFPLSECLPTTERPLNVGGP